MSDEQKIATVTAEAEAAPALPTSEPPVEDPKPEATTTTTAELVAPVTTETNGTAPATEENGEAKPEEGKTEEKRGSRLKKRLTLKWGKNRDQTEAPKEPEAPADPRADVIAWITQQIPVAVHKVNYNVLEWIQKLAVDDEAARQALPGKDGQVTRNQFLAFLRDGDLLAKLANKLQPGAVETVVAEEGADAIKQKEVHAQNIQNFATWAQQATGAEEGKSMTAADLLEKGKAGYPAVFDTLWGLGIKAQEKFEKEGLDVDGIVNTVSNTVRTTIIGQIVAFFRRNRRPAAETAAEEKAQAAEEAAEAAENQAEEPLAEKKVENETTLAPAAVPAN